MRNDRGESLRKVDIAQKPDQAIEQQILNRAIKLELQSSGNPGVKRIDVGVERGHAVAVTHGRECGGNARHRCASLIADADDKRGAAAIYDGIGELSGNNFPPQPMLLERVGKSLGDGFGKIAAELAAQIRIVRHARLHELVVERELGIGEQHSKLGSRQSLRTPSAIGDLHIVG